MTNVRRSIAGVGVAALLATPLSILAASPATAEADREFNLAGAEIDFDVEKDDGRFDVEVDLDEARPGSKWRVTLWHDGKRFHHKVHTADSDGEFEIDRERRNTRGKDVFKLRVKKIGGPKKVRTITMR